LTDPRERALTIVEAALNFRICATLLSLPLALLACSASTVALDGALIESSNDPSVLGIVRERVEKIAVDDERLYWSGSHLPRTDGANVWFLHSCQKTDCASTLVTYDAQGYTAEGVFSVSGGEVRWYRSNSRELVSCPIAGCNGAPRTLVSDLGFSAAAFDDNRFYFSDQWALYSVPLSQPGPRQPLGSSQAALLSVAVDDVYVYWLEIDAPDGSGLVRVRKDGSSPVETVSNDVKYSYHHHFSLTTDTTSVYWTNNLLTGSINRCPLTGCSDASDVVITPLRAPQKLQIDGSELYYQYEPRPYEYALSSCTLPACAPSEPLIEHLDAPSALAMDDEYLYVATTEQDVSPANLYENTVASIRRLPKPNRGAP
jgi:hypothetical protein